MTTASAAYPAGNATRVAGMGPSRVPFVRTWVWGAHRDDVLAVIGIVVVTAAAFWNPLYDPLRAIQEDIALEMQGLHAAANDQLWRCQFPHWNPYGLGGERLFADIHLALLYPGSILFRFFAFPGACLATWILHYAGTAVATYALARRLLKVHPIAAALSACVFALGGFCLGHCNHLNFVFALPWLPLLLQSAHAFHTSEGGQAWIGWGLGVMCLSFLILSGGTPVLVLALVSLAWLTLAFIVRDLLRGCHRSILRLTLGVAAMGLLALGLTAFQLMPTMDLYSGSARTGWSQDKLLAGGIPWRALLYQLIAPGVLGDQASGDWARVGHETLVFVGGVALTYAVLGACMLRRHPWVPALFVLLAVSTVLALGDTPVLRAVNGLVPLVKMRQPSRYVGLIQLVIALLAAVGMDRWLTARSGPPSRLTQAMCWLVFAVMSVSSVWLLRWLGAAGVSPEGFAHWQAQQSEGVRAWLQGASYAAISRITTGRGPASTALSVLACSGGLVFWGCSWLTVRRPRVAVGVVCACCILELLLFGKGTWAGQGRFPGIVSSPPPIVRFLREHLGDERYFNAAVYLPLWENRGAVYGLSNTDGYVGSKLNVSREHEALFRSMHGRLTELNLFSTKYVLLREGRDPGPLGPVFRDDDVVVCENLFRVPRAAFLMDARTERDIEAALAVMNDPDFDPRRTGVLTGDALVSEGTSLPSGPSEYCRITRWAPGRIEIEFECQVPRRTFIGTSYDKGWTAATDGCSTALTRTNVCFMSALAPPGHHILALSYETPQLRAGCAVSVATMLVLAAAAAFRLLASGERTIAVSRICDTRTG